MSSILTNPSALTALQALRLTQKNLSETQNQVSTGLKVGSAADNASTWSIAEKMKSQQSVLSAIHDNLAQSSAMLSAASASLASALSVMNTIKQAVLQAKVPGADTAAIGTNITNLGNQLASIVTSATINGLNLLDGSQTSAVTFVSSYKSNNGASASTIGTISLTPTALTGNNGASPPVNNGKVNAALATGSSAATDFTSLSATDVGSAVVNDTLSNADKAIADLTTYASTIGATENRIALQTSFVSALQDALSNAVSALVDADMNEASTRIQALQTQQQLGIQALSIANQNAQAILKLFQ